MLINFALDLLGTTVTNDKVSTDGFESSNLISSNYRTRTKGFIAEHFVKPPIHITFTFPCTVNLSHIVLEPYVGQQHSLQLELLCATKPKANNPSCDLGCQNQLQQSSPQSNTYLSAFYKVSTITTTTKSPLCFYNCYFRHNSLFNNINDFVHYQHKSEMRNFRKELFTSASQILLKITRTERGLTAAINKLEIWGSVSSTTSPELRKSVEQKYVKFLTPSIPSSTSIQNDDLESKPQANELRKSSSQFQLVDTRKSEINVDVPEEFLDTITWEVMTIPMLLPCGKNVDKSSLDRFSDSEATHGRQPRDPFTGIQFTDNIKPIPNASLKVRIDEFLMSNSNVTSIASLPRTVSEGKSSQVRNKRKAVDGNGLKISSLVEPSSKKSSSCNSLSQILKVEESLVSSTANTRSEVSDLPSTSSSIQIQGNDRNKPHEMRLKDSLNSALSSILSTFSSEERNIKQMIQRNEACTTDGHCIYCDIDMKSNSLKYATPCSHILCRKCLLSFNSPQQNCKRCGMIFDTKDITRTH